MADRAEPEIPQLSADSLKGAGLPEAEALCTSEISAPMQDVHAPHESIHTWKDFIIHIATITIGLLIAIGLEQTVEYFHHRHQAAEMSGKLKMESNENIAVVRDDIETYDHTLAAIKAIEDNLDQHSKASPAAPWVPQMLPETPIYKPSDAEWLIARDSALLQILPSALVANYWKIESTRERTDRLVSDASRSRIRLDALLEVYAAQSALNPTDALAVRLALREYAQYLRQVRLGLQHIAELNQITLDGKVIGSGAAPNDAPLEPAR